MNTANEEIHLLIQQYYNPLLCFVRNRIDSASDAEDIVQETWMRSLGMIGVGAVQNVRAYLYRVARNLIVDHLRLGGRQIPTDESVLLAVQDERVDIELDLIQKEEIERLDAAIKEMSERARQMFLLARVEGLSYAQIGRKFGISRQTVHEQMTHAIRVLQNKLQSNEYD